MSPQNTKRMVIVLGMHRSGTSAITRALMALGVRLGSELLPPLEENPKGFWEEPDVMALNDTLLSALGMTWDSLSPLFPDRLTKVCSKDLLERGCEIVARGTAEADVYGVKDPRLCRLVPFWKTICYQVGVATSYVIVVRNPLSVAKSLEIRNGVPLAKSLYLWLEHVVAAAVDTEGDARVFVGYDRMLDDPAVEMRRISSGLALPEPDPSAFEQYRQEFLEKALRHSQFKRDDLDGNRAVPSLVVRAFDLLEQLAADELPSNSPAVADAFRRLADELNALAPVLDHASQVERSLGEASQAIAMRDATVLALTETIAEHEAQLAERDRHLETLAKALRERDRGMELMARTVAEQAARIDAVMNSTSWKVTAPLRALGRLGLGFRGN